MEQSRHSENYKLKKNPMARKKHKEIKSLGTDRHNKGERLERIKVSK